MYYLIVYFTVLCINCFIADVTQKEFKVCFKELHTILFKRYLSRRNVLLEVSEALNSFSKFGRLRMEFSGSKSHSSVDAQQFQIINIWIVQFGLKTT